MSKTRCFCAFLVLIILSRCAPVNQTSTTPTFKPIDLLISNEEMPVGWKSFEAFSDEYDDLCYIDCAIIQFSPVEEDKAYSEQYIYVYNTIEEAERNYERQLIPLQLGTAPSESKGTMMWNNEPISRLPPQADRSPLLKSLEWEKQ